jgi:hypothetical protein
MTTDEIIDTGHKAGTLFLTQFGVASVTTEWLENFAALIAAAEREACAKVCDDKAKETFSGQCQVWGDYFARVIRARSNT